MELDWSQWTVLILMFLVWFKAMMGFHFPWERCDCCNKKYRDHPGWYGNPEKEEENGI